MATISEWAIHFTERIKSSDNIAVTIDEISRELNGFVYASGEHQGAPVSREWKLAVLQEILRLLQVRRVDFSAQQSQTRLAKIACANNEEAISLIEIVMRGQK